MTLSEESMDLNWKSQVIWGVRLPQPILGLIGLKDSAGIHFETISVFPFKENFIARNVNCKIFCYKYFVLIFS